jgi:hypothetical protein
MHFQFVARLRGVEPNRHAEIFVSRKKGVTAFFVDIYRYYFSNKYTLSTR